MPTQGWQGWDEYAPFYDWENARTLGRADVPFWQRLARQRGGAALELGCGTGRISVPLARAGIPLVGVDRSAAMLSRASARADAAERAGAVMCGWCAATSARFLSAPASLRLSSRLMVFFSLCCASAISWRRSLRSPES